MYSHGNFGFEELKWLPYVFVSKPTEASFIAGVEALTEVFGEPYFVGFWFL